MISTQPTPFAQPLYLISATYLTMAGAAAGLILLVRMPMGEPHWTAVLKALLLSGAVMLAWQETATRVLRGSLCSYALALLVVLIVLFSPMVVWLGAAIAAVILYGALGLIWLIGLASLARGLRELPLWNALSAVAVGLALGVAYFFIVNTKGYANVFTPEEALLGTQHRDTLFHASLAAMLGKFGVASTGLDGLVPARYHALSHALIGLSARWMGVASIHAYYLMPQIVGIPLLFFSVSAASYWLWRPERPVAAAVLVVLVPLAMLLTLEIWDWASYLVSESYFLSLIILLLTLPLLLEFLERPQIPCWLLRYVVLAVCVLAAFFAKNSVGAVLAVGGGYALVRSRGLVIGNLFKIGIPLALVAALGLLTTYQPFYTSSSLLSPLHFLNTYPDGAWPNLVAIVLMFAMAAYLWSRGSIRQRPIIEVLVVLAVASLIPALLLRVGAGAAYYFLNVGSWIAIVFAAGFVFLPRLARIDRPVLLTAATALLAVIAAVYEPALRNSGSNFSAMLDQQSSQSAERPSHFGGVWLKLFSPADGTRARLAETARGSPGGQMQELLRKAGMFGSRDLVVHVPPDNAVFWSLPRLCSAAPFLVPAAAGLPMVHGLPPSKETCPIGPDHGYGYSAYSERARSAPLSDAQLCERVREIGFKRVLIIETPSDARILTCLPER